MIKAVIVEDEEEQSNALKNFLIKYSDEKRVFFDVQTFSNAITFLDRYTADYDIVFIDIRMPYMNGIDAAHYLRRKDENVTIIFVTSLKQYAVEGYSVDAAGYLLKPVSFADFSLTLTRILRKITPRESNEYIVLPMLEGNIRLRPSDIVYLESNGHQVVYHTVERAYTRYCSLKTAAEELKDKGFSFCNRCYIVNLKHVKYIKAYTVNINDTELQISRPRKKDFLNDFKEYQSKGV